MDAQLLKQVILDQAEEADFPNIIPRNAMQKVMPLVNSPQVLILTGIRRSGKSVLMNSIRKQQPLNDYYINFDDDRLALFQLEDFQLLLDVFIELYGVQNHFYFDEIQNIVGWEMFVRRLHNKKQKVFITGSNATLLSRELGTHLTGRHIAIELYPFSFTEYVYLRDAALLKDLPHNSTQIALLKKYFAEYKTVGGLPEYLENQQQQYLHTLYESILFKDIIVRYKLTQQKPIKELVYYLASNNAKEFTYNSLRKLLGLASSNTVAEYCQYLENSYLAFSINRFAYSLKKQTHFAKKIYFIDPALAASVGFRSSEDAGRSLENIVFLELKRQGKNIYFHKEKQECDFVIREGYRIKAAIQVCMSLKNTTTKEREIQGLLEAMHAYNLNEGLILTENESGEENIQYAEKTLKITIEPCWKWLLKHDFMLQS
ncbi:MAG: hypothetical protein A3F18_03295 [Legionellales bacterium RIFCSPHIGHO2_12_FULL_37_14]|nr:MAG: hypothetical protein A3F18_03295 [Legionellales bacterium RIFCSPHIGHO2_12_FULL_37_14]